MGLASTLPGRGIFQVFLEQLSCPFSVCGITRCSEGLGPVQGLPPCTEREKEVGGNVLQFSPAPPCHPGNRDPLGVCGTTEIWGPVACDLGEATSASQTSASQYFSWLLEGFLEVLFTLVENGPSASSPPLSAPSSVLLTLELTLKLWKTMLFFFLGISYGPQGKAS